MAGVQLANSSHGAPAPAAPAGANAGLPAGNASDLTNPQTEISSIGTVDTTDIDRRINFWKQRTQTTTNSEDNWTAWATYST